MYAGRLHATCGVATAAAGAAVGVQMARRGAKHQDPKTLMMMVHNVMRACMAVECCVQAKAALRHCARWLFERDTGS